jgi:hypothetical protein
MTSSLHAFAVTFECFTDVSSFLADKMVEHRYEQSSKVSLQDSDSNSSMIEISHFLESLEQDARTERNDSDEGLWPIEER